jgi:hypothetical protein
MNSTVRGRLRWRDDAGVLDGGAPADGCVPASPKNFHTVTGSFKRFMGIERATARIPWAQARKIPDDMGGAVRAWSN